MFSSEPWGGIEPCLDDADLGMFGLVLGKQSIMKWRVAASSVTLQDFRL